MSGDVGGRGSRNKKEASTKSREQWERRVCLCACVCLRRMDGCRCVRFCRNALSFSLPVRACDLAPRPAPSFSHSLSRSPASLWARLTLLLSSCAARMMIASGHGGMCVRVCAYSSPCMRTRTDIGIHACAPFCVSLRPLSASRHKWARIASAPPEGRRAARFLAEHVCMGDLPIG